MLAALETHRGNVTNAAKSIDMARAQHYHWMQTDPEYRAAVDELDNVVIDWVEGHFHQRILKGSDACTIFFLKTKGRGRGYIERSDWTGDTGDPQVFKIGDQVIKF